MPLSGLLVIDKPVGPTSHDVVARMRRVLGESRIGHTGTLDPNASGVLPLVVGRATRLARYLSGADKTYDAAIRLGIATDTYDSAGTPVGQPHAGALPDRETIDRALEAFRGAFQQQPPAYSAKKIDGRRSYALARAAAREADVSPRPSAPAAQPGHARLPDAVAVRTYSVRIVDLRTELLTVRVTCSAGFYVRSLAHDLGERLGIGAHLAALRRTQAGDVTLADAVPLDQLLTPDGRSTALKRLVPLANMLPALDAVTLTAEGVRRATHGRDLGPADFTEIPADPTKPGTVGGVSSSPASSSRLSGVRLLDVAGELVGVAEPLAAGVLHPCVVLV
jgi:tRNA pseudouridine55 synthase